MNANPMVCPHCGANTTSNKRCWLCHGDVTRRSGEKEMTIQDAYASPPPLPPPAGVQDSYQSGLVGMVLVIGLLVVCGVLFQISPGLAFWIAILSTPALIRTTVVIMRKDRQGEHVSTGEKSMLFLASVGGVLVACTAAGAAFFIACTASCFGLAATSSLGGSEQTFGVLLLASVVLSLLVGGLVLYLMWRKR